MGNRQTLDSCGDSMSNEMKTPWFVTQAADDTYTVLDAIGYPLARGADDELAAHIVKCVNAHEGLVEALRSILDMCNEDSHARDYASRQTEIRGTAIVAIRKAQGESA